MEKDITGVMVYYYFVCQRKLWYFANELTMEKLSDDVAIGRLIDQNAYPKDNKHINIDNIINIDFIRGKDILHEVKKSKSIEEASIWQVKYYLYYLKKHGAAVTRARLDFPLIKDTLMVELEDGDEKQITHYLRDIRDIISKPLPPLREKDKACKKCAYYELCFI